MAEKSGGIGCGGILLIVALATCFGIMTGRDERDGQRTAAPEPEPARLCTARRTASAEDRELQLVGVLAHLNPYDYLPGCLTYPRNFARLMSAFDNFCGSSAATDSVVYRALRDTAEDLCGRR